MKPVSLNYIFAPYGIIATGFIAGVCFFVCGMLVKTFAKEIKRNE
jgi:hypothetical protein